MYAIRSYYDVMDISDYKAFDKQEGGTNSVSVFIHETVEQFEKAKSGYDAGEYPGAGNDIIGGIRQLFGWNPSEEWHDAAMKAEDAVGDYKRTTHGKGKEKYSLIKTKSGSVIRQEVNYRKNGEVDVDKEIIK